MNACEPVGGFVPHGLIHVAVQDRADGATCAMMHAVVELEVADEELGFLDVVVQGVQLRLVQTVVLTEFRVEALQRFEVFPLACLEQRLAEVQIADVVGARRAAEQRQGELQPDGPGDGSGHGYQSLRAIGDLPELGSTVMPIRAGSMPLSKVKRSAWAKSLPLGSLPSTETSRAWVPMGRLPM